VIFPVNNGVVKFVKQKQGCPLGSLVAKQLEC